jgi:hypothetical protein
MTTRLVELDSPYGFLTTPGGGRIANGTPGALEKDFHPDAYNSVQFADERFSISVPGFWLKKVEP